MNPIEALLYHNKYVLTHVNFPVSVLFFVFVMNTLNKKKHETLNRSNCIFCSFSIKMYLSTCIFYKQFFFL